MAAAKTTPAYFMGQNFIGPYDFVIVTVIVFASRSKVARNILIKSEFFKIKVQFTISPQGVALLKNLNKYVPLKTT